MYTYVKAVSLAKTTGAQWTDTDISNILVYYIFDTFEHIYLELSHNELPNSVYVDFGLMKDRFSSYAGTLNELLISIGNETLPTVPSLPSTIFKYVKYSDAIRAGYKIGLTKIGSVAPNNYPAENLPDLKVNREKYKTNMKLVHDYCLVTVNGYLHQTDAEVDGSYFYVKDGAKTMRISDGNNLGIMSFLDIGKVTKLPIDSSNILRETASTPLSDKIIIRLPVNINNKTVLLSLGGYLIFPENNVFWKSGDNALTLLIKNTPILERFYESRLYIDLSSLNLTPIVSNPYQINIEEFLSDENIIKYLLLSQSFIIIIDNSLISTKKIFLQHHSMPGMFTCYQDPVYPLIVNYGKLADYWKTKEDDRWSVTVTDSYFRNYVFVYNEHYTLPTVTDQKYPGKPYSHSRGYMLEIGAQVNPNN